MPPPSNRFLDTPPSIFQVICILAAIYGVTKYIKAKRSPLNAIPTVGYSGVLTSYITAIQFAINGPALIQEGYDKYHNRLFKVAALTKWVVLLSGKQHIDDLRLASDDVLSFSEAVEEILHTKYTIGALGMHPHHRVTVRSKVNRNLVTKSHEIADEVESALQQLIPATEDWVTVTAFATVQKIICRTINRFFVGTPLCRDPGYCKVMENYTVEAAVSGKIIGCFPEFLRPFVGGYLTPVSRSIKKAMKYLGPTIADSLEKYEQYEMDDPNRPNDLINWFLDTATEDYHRTPRDIVNRILFLNFASIHTTSMSLTQTLYDIASHPEYLDELRAEAESAIQESGWTKTAIQKLRKLDSFIKESLRLNSTGGLIMPRRVLKDWTMSDGTLIPAGSFIALASAAMARSKDNFEDADTFKGFRFTEMRNGDGEFDKIKYQMVSLQYDQVIFGHGRHACPGRFLAIHEIKIILAHILLQYDVQFENGSLDRPPNSIIDTHIMPNTKAKMRFRKRKIDS